ncbi:cyclopropane-fatty-acyl-phospholipid synthase family protein [Vibrio sp. Of7-15]|uniref:SAM-dependent methyltransferase n=1 Tax=Vibrio sp. Of7-15 TaxID=2724879 RepID=UPI001EF35720|nr:cyclopropane-fatty-acyl-phospholipid synthase family protein [Vibrio sp. Of7-15]MCG7497867.1 cyclopropane-fatty-acyl-phospholipid synthase family protein [Vibrio sp. Of7-15]
MEQITKQVNTIAHKKGTLSNKVVGKYRDFIFGVLANLRGASMEVMEDNELFFWGEKGSVLHGKIIVRDPSFYQDVVLNGSLGAAEAYLDGKWDSPDLTAVIQVMARNQAQLDQVDSQIKWFNRLQKWLLRRKNMNTEQGSKRNILAHYDLGNELYTRFLDPSMQYSCAIYNGKSDTLSQAQQHKMHTICERLEINADDHIIEIGTGWGGLAIYMAEHYGCHVTTTTISDAQYQYTAEKIQQLGLNDRITLLNKDYRQLSGKYNKLVSIEMIEAVGHEYLATFLNKCSELLEDDGKMLIQSITIADGRYENYRKSTDFIQKYIFPGGCLPSVAIITNKMAQHTDLVVHEMHDIGLHYARTLFDWRVGFEERWDQLKELGYTEEFRRLWLFYLCYCEGAFLQRTISTHHVIARKPRFRGQQDEIVLGY